VPETWTNWAREQRCAPERVGRPASEEELQHIVRGARTLRAVGSGHSFTDIACTDGVQVDLSRMRRVLAVDGADVTVEAGITLRDLGEELASRELALENQGDIDAQTLAGAISTATHGTGGRFRNLSAQVVGLRIVDGSGEVVDVRGEDELRAARVSLGALGLIASVTVRCVPAFRIHRVDEPRPLDHLLARLDELVDAVDHFEAFVLPHTRTALTLTSERTDRPARPRSRVRAAFQDLVVENAVLGAAFRLGRVRPALIPTVNRLLAKAMSRTEYLDASNRVYANERRVRFTEMEYAIPRERAAEALERVLALIERRRLPVGFPIELRVVARPPTSPCTSTTAWSSRPTSGGSRRSWTSTAGGPTGASATTSPPTRWRPAIPSGSASRGSAGASTPRAAS
jgi:FAD-linked oxidoreductase